MDSYSWIELTSLSIGLILTVFFIAFAIVSVYEKEKRASRVSTAIALVLLLIFTGMWLFNIPLEEYIHFLIIGTTGISLLIIFMPFRPKADIANVGGQIDERDIMFSRKLLEKGTERYRSYYSNKPEIELLDNKFRQKPGLLAKDASYFHPFYFAASKASFQTVEHFHPFLEQSPNLEKQEYDPKALTNFIINWSKKLGALDVGITEIKEYHKYSHIGREKEYGNEVLLNHKYAIAFTVEMDHQIMQSAPEGPTVMESAQQYMDSGSIALQVAHFIQELGYEARPHIDGSYRLVAPLVARDAGLGELGRMGLLMTPKHGPRVRIALVSTNADLINSKSKSDSSVEAFCRICKKCADNCPSLAISFKDKEKVGESIRWQINSEACFTYWCTIGTDCGKCMKVCPYSHPDSIMHNIIRWGIKKSSLFQYFALKLDDIFYGRKASNAQKLDW